MSNENDIKLIVSLLEQTTTLSIVQKFLKKNQLAYSGTWEEVYSKRILPAVLDGKIQTKTLVDFLSEVEEFGNHHVFCIKLMISRNYIGYLTRKL